MPLLDLWIRNQLWTGEQEGTQIAQNATKSDTRSTDYGTKILACIGEALERFGSGIPKIILYNICWLSGLRYEEIPDRPVEFEACLESVFRSGSAAVKHAVVEEVKSGFGLTENYATFKDCFEAAKAKLEF